MYVWPPSQGMATNFFDCQADELVRSLLAADRGPQAGEEGGDGGEGGEQSVSAAEEGAAVRVGAGSVAGAFSRRRGLRKRNKRRLQRSNSHQDSDSDDDNDRDRDSEGVRSSGDVDR